MNTNKPNSLHSHVEDDSFGSPPSFKASEGWSLDAQCRAASVQKSSDF